MLIHKQSLITINHGRGNIKNTKQVDDILQLQHQFKGFVNNISYSSMMNIKVWSIFAGPIQNFKRSSIQTSIIQEWIWKRNNFAMLCICFYKNTKRYFAVPMLQAKPMRLNIFSLVADDVMQTSHVWQERDSNPRHRSDWCLKPAP